MKKPINSRSAAFLFVLALLGQPVVTLATPGGVNSEGCHNSKTAGYHCHPARAKASRSLPSSQENAKERSQRLKRECKGSRNAGACLGYGSF